MIVMTHIKTTNRKSKVARRMKKRLTGDIHPPRLVPETISSLTIMGIEDVVEVEFCNMGGGAKCTRCWGGGGIGICAIAL